MTNTLSFEPNVVHVNVGDTVEWRNTSFFTHSVTGDPGLAEDPEDAALPTGAEPFNARVAAGEVYRHKFAVRGTYLYFCIPHEDHDMVGQVIVE